MKPESRDRPKPRLMPLPLQELSAEAVRTFGQWQASEAEGGVTRAGAAAIVSLFWRQPDGSLELELSAGQVVYLGPASDPMRCRALPSLSQFRAYRASSAGTLSLGPGVWLGQTPELEPQLEGRDLERRDAEAIFKLAFQAKVMPLPVLDQSLIPGAQAFVSRSPDDQS